MILMMGMGILIIVALRKKVEEKLPHVCSVYSILHIMNISGFLQKSLPNRLENDWLVHYSFKRAHK